LSITAIAQYSPGYFPSWMEISVTLMIVALGFAAFWLAAKFLPIFPPQKNEPAASVQAKEKDIVGFIDVPAAAFSRAGELIRN
ncbi:MAG: Ni/Fe-hydrogenase cytochrome b subunit, partial [Bacteroidetes bacterium]|nr:Ni/Fe-hydrogenase cytochrome b subunit [Bacteroidota bacterium]